MTEELVIAKTNRPATRDSLRVDLRALGVRPGMTLLVHSSLSALGWVCGGAHTVALTLLDAVGVNGTLVMPTHSSDLSDPVYWCNPPVPSNWWPTIRESMPAFDVHATPTRLMGSIPEVFRTMTGVLRSQHPQFSFAACGPQAEHITKEHQLNFGLGDGSPLARLYELDGHVLLLGVGHERNTSLHLAEYRVEPRRSKSVENGAPVLRDGKRQWIHINDLELNCGDFDKLGESFRKKSSTYQSGRVGEGSAELMSQPELVDFGIRWMAKHR